MHYAIIIITVLLALPFSIKECVRAGRIGYLTRENRFERHIAFLFAWNWTQITLNFEIS